MPYGGFSKSDIRIDTRLTNVALGYRNAEHISDVLFPKLPGPIADSGKVMVYGPNVFGYGNDRSVWADGTDDNFVDDSISDITYNCVQHARARIVTDTEVRNSDPPHRPFDRAAVLVRARLLLQMERDAATKATTAANYAAALYLDRSVLDAGVWQWSDFTSGKSDPINDVIVACEAVRASIGTGPTVWAMGGSVWAKFCQHPDVIEIIKYGARGVKGNTSAVLTPEEVQGFFSSFGIKKVAIGKARYNTADQGQTVSTSDVWGKKCVFAHVPDSFGVTGEPTYGFRVSTVDTVIERDPPAKHAVVIRGVGNWHHMFGIQDGTGDALAGYLLDNVIA